MKTKPQVSLKAMLRNCHAAFLAAGLFSFAVNLLMLTMPIYMFQIFDRVMASRNLATLFLLFVMAVAALLVQAGLDAVRSQMFVRISAWMDRRVSPIMISTLIKRAVSRGLTTDVAPLRALTTVRNFLTGTGIITLLDVPWVPVFLLLIVWMNPMLGAAALFGAVLMAVLGIVNEFYTKRPLKDASTSAARASRQADVAVRNAAVVEAMGMRPAMLQRWHVLNEQTLRLQCRASDVGAVIQGLTKSARMLMMILIMTVAMIEIIDPETALTPGAMIATMLILGRALQPLEQVITQWKPLIEAVQAYQLVELALADGQAEPDRMALPAPRGALSVENVHYQVPGVHRPILQRVSFQVQPGEALGIIGPSAAGKSSLARLLVGVERPTVGSVRLDGADIFDWDPVLLGSYIGYVPQDVELFAGTVAENIARMAPRPDAEKVIAAAQLAGLHELILRLPDGYDTEIGAGGGILSGGQRQRVALARALYGEPRLLVLDEPNSHLDSQGDDALLKAIEALKERGAAVIMITHRPTTLSVCDKVLILQNGVVQKFGPRDEALSLIARPQPPQRPEPALNVASVHAISAKPQG